MPVVVLDHDAAAGANPLGAGGRRHDRDAAGHRFEHLHLHPAAAARSGRSGRRDPREPVGGGRDRAEHLDPRLERDVDQLLRASPGDEQPRLGHDPTDERPDLVDRAGASRPPFPARSRCRSSRPPAGRRAEPADRAQGRARAGRRRPLPSVRARRSASAISGELATRCRLLAIARLSASVSSEDVPELAAPRRAEVAVEPGEIVDVDDARQLQALVRPVQPRSPPDARRLPLPRPRESGPRTGRGRARRAGAGTARARVRSPGRSGGTVTSSTGRSAGGSPGYGERLARRHGTDVDAVRDQAAEEPDRDLSRRASLGERRLGQRDCDAEGIRHVCEDARAKRDVVALRRIMTATRRDTVL